MFVPLLSACASFEPAWRAFVVESEEHAPEEPLYFVVLGDLAAHLLDLDARGQISEFGAVFAVVEKWLQDGDPYVRNATVIGLFEGLQNVAGWREQNLTRIESYLRPISKTWWDNLNRYWAGDVSALNGL